MDKSIKILSFCKILKRTFPDIVVRSDRSFKDLTTFKIGGKIKCLVEIDSINNLLKVLGLVKKYNLP